MNIRSNLLLLTLAALLPVAVFAAAVGYFLVDEQRDTFRRGVEERALALLTAVDTVLQGSMVTVEALSLTESLAKDDFSYFRTTAKRMLARQGNWININVARPDRERVLDLLAPEGASLPPITDSGELSRLLKQEKPVVGDLEVGPVSGKWNYGVRVPVMRQGRVQYVLTAVASPEKLVDILVKQGMDRDWIAMVLDRSGRIVARTRDPEHSTGRRASPELVAAISRGSAGWVHGPSFEGVDYEKRYIVSKRSGWTVVLGAPSSTFDAVAWQAGGLFIAGLITTIAIALGLAVAVARRMSAPLIALARTAEAFGRDEATALPAVGGPGEIQTLGRALRETIGAVREREEQFRILADAAPVFIWMTDTEGLCTWTNKAWLSFVGRPLEQELGNGWADNIHPDDRQRCLQTYGAAFDRRQPSEVEVRMRRHDGDYRWVLSHGVPHFDTELNFSGYVGSAVDIHDRKVAEATLARSEERLRMALAAGRMGTWEWNIGANQVIWSPYLEALHGLAPGTFPGTFAAYESDIHPDDREMVRQAIARHLESGEDHHIEYRIVWPDGSVHWVEGRGTIYRDATGSPICMIGVCIDVTARKQSEQALKEADRHKDEFLAILSHELRNPLAALATASHVLRLGARDDRSRQDAAGIIERQSIHMGRLIDDLSDMARVQWGKLTLQCELLNLGDFVSEVIQSWRSAGRLAASVALEVEIAPAWANADRTRLEQIFSNLLHNAVKFTPPTASIRVSVCREAHEAVLRVADTGVGIAPESLTAVFEPFMQAETAFRASGSAGLGLGLALVRRLTDLHGGSVSVESAGIGKGAAFTVRLPAADAPVRSQGTSQPQPLLNPASLRILIIEDNEDARASLKTALSLAGYDAEAASNGAAGLAAITNGGWNIAVIDIGLPDMGGFEVARRIRSSDNGAAIGLIALSGYGQDDYRSSAGEAGFDVYLVKPISPERLGEVIRELAQTRGIRATDFDNTSDSVVAVN